MSREPPPGFGKLPADKNDFADKLAVLCALEMSYARRDNERMGVMIERLCNSLGMTLAVACAASGKPVDDLIMGCEGYIHTSAVSYGPIAKATNYAPYGGA